MDLEVNLPAEGGDGCTLLANELLVGAMKLLLNPRGVLVREVANPSEVPGRSEPLFAGAARSSLKPEDILRMAEAGDMVLVEAALSVRNAAGPASGADGALVSEAFRSLRKGLRRWKPRLVSGLAGRVSSRAAESARGLCGGDANRFFLTDLALAGSNTPDNRRPKDVRGGCGDEDVAAANELVLCDANGRSNTGLVGSVDV